MNRAEAQANNRAVDSLINYETVKYCGNEEHEVARYDECMAKYQVQGRADSSDMQGGKESFPCELPALHWLLCGAVAFYVKQTSCCGCFMTVALAMKLLADLW
jgi:hypothetical protein